MSVRPLLIFPHPMLRQPSQPVTWKKQGAAIAKVAEDLVDTLRALNGAGLAAIQIGVPVRMLAIAQRGGDPMVLINPVIVERRGAAQRVEEGCLSFPKVWIKVTRSPIVVVKSAVYPGDDESEHIFDEIEAQGIQHELEHLDGKLLIDHATPLAKRLILQRMKRYTKHARATGRRLSP